ncbi:hypothetical protein DPMN_048159 [Dreissena polymorpha]|uniref:SRCR domain-containing protein n=2 Tax=Dreissena polymorpha TaxID=45954 RepID=A0A9D4DB40_DREPO|nr:hypothetical protein DPMN_048159 [Dreissena polymorpha]
MLEPCPVPIGWRTWGEWGSCSTTCGVGIQSRNRSCVEPARYRLSDNCFGDTKEHQICMKRACADGGWTTWSSWSTCSASCGGGIYQRSRGCTNPSPSPYGQNCEGPNNDVATCNSELCPQKAGGWSGWSSWSSCTATCFGGNRQRYRGCINPLPSPFGQPCVGPSVDVDSCSTHNCAARLNSRRFEIFLNSQWGTVCNDQFDANNNGAKVVCRMLGLPTSNAMYIDPEDGPSSMPIWLDEVICTGNEESLLNCDRNSVGVHNCGHTEDVGVLCF